MSRLYPRNAQFVELRGDALGRPGNDRATSRPLGSSPRSPTIRLNGMLSTAARRVNFRDFFCSARPQVAKFGLRLTRRGVFVFPVGTLISEHPPDRSERAQFGHSAPTSGV